jgi:hypothetical protein
MKSHADIVPGSRPAASVFVGPGYSRKYAHTPEPAAEIHPEAGERYLCPELGCWRLVPAREVPSGNHDVARRPLARPESDGTGVRWDVVDKLTGHRLWTVEKFGYPDAYDEAVRLCAAAGGRIDEVRITPCHR